MKRLVMLGCLALAAGTVLAQGASVKADNRLGEDWWKKRFEEKKGLAKQGAELVLLGDSITHGWEGAGRGVWERSFGQYKMLNLGYGGDRTEHVLWRLDNGELDGVNPKLVMLMIGTNNTGHRPEGQESPLDTVAGVRAVLDKLGQKAPQAKVLLLAVFPRGATAQDGLRVRNEKVNEEIRKFADNKRVFWMDINDAFLAPGGELPKDVMPDLLHPNEKGYAIWAEKVAPFVAKTVRASVTPDSRMGEGWWLGRFRQKVELAKQGGWELVFMGDSITHGWENAGKGVWEKAFGSYKALNLGYSGDRTEHVLWRLDHGELDGYQPKLLVLMIGTNNTGHRPLAQESPEDTAAGIKAILEKIGQKSPSTKVLLLAVFPRGEKPGDGLRVRNDKVNALIKGYADGERVLWLDINAKLLAPDGTLTKEMMPDLLHPKEKGYGVWAEAVAPVIREVLGR